MKKFNMFSFNIGQRLLLLALCLSLGLGAIAVFSFFQLKEVKETARHAEKVRVRQLGYAAATELNVTRISLQLRHAILARNPAEMQAALSDIKDKHFLIKEYVQSYQNLLGNEKTSAIEKEKSHTLFAKLPAALDHFWKVSESNIQQINQGEKEAAFAFLVEQTIPARNQVLAVLSEMVAYQGVQLTQDIDGIGRSVDTIGNAIVLLALCCTIILLATSVYLGRVLRRRVQFTRQVVEQIRDGNLSQPIEDNAHDEFSPLVAAMENMQVQLNQVVTSVRQGADFVEIASDSIADDNNNLSYRTQWQAESLHATTDAAKLLAGIIADNFDHAKNAVSLSNQAVDVTQRGGTVVSDVVSTMQEINASSQRIEEIIGVIDAIAFQTNILALNAAVEAARAGEQGRGFAVVAAEVRSLAQRSSQAAHEIKELISTSVEKVSVGSELVAQAGNTMQEIVESIQKVKDIVNNINTASEEQQRSLVEVNSTMSNMQNATNENSALVEKMNHSSSELRNMAHQLVSTMSYFRTNHTNKFPH
jgi:methyl-accepting chemotaxis protein